MRFYVDITCDSAAFNEHDGYMEWEVTRILKEVAELVGDSNVKQGGVFDCNGQPACTFGFKEETP